MAKTGESYTTARRRLRASAPEVFGDILQDGPAGSSAGAANAASNARQLAHVERRRGWIAQTTGKDMDQWVTILDQAGARTMTHRQIWRLLADAGHVAEGMAREGIVITYEQLIGRREVGQSCDGDYRATVMRTQAGTLDSVLRSWLGVVDESTTFNGVDLRDQPSVSASEKFRYWRAGLADGTQVKVSIYRRPDGKVSVGLQHRPFADRVAAAAWQTYWKEFMAPLSALRPSDEEVG